MQHWGSTRDAALAARVTELLVLQQQAAAAGRGLATLLDAPPASSKRSVAFTSPNALAADVASTQRLLRETTASDPEDQQQPEMSDGQDVVAIPTVQELPGLLNDLYQTLQGARLSAIKQTYVDALMQVVIAGLTRLALTKPTASQSQPLGPVRVWLLEMAVRPTPLSRRLAFTLLYNISVTTTAILLVESADKTKEWQARLFQVLVEMLSKAVVVASSSSPAPTEPTMENAADLVWIETALSSLLLFVKHKDRLRADRLAQLDPQILCFLIQEIYSERGPSAIDHNATSLKLVELLVLSIYSHQHHLQPKDDISHARSDSTSFGLSVALIERFGGIDFLLAIFYSTASWRLQTLLFMAFFDRAVDHTRTQSRKEEDRGELETLLRHLVRLALPQTLASSPLLFAGSSFPNVTKKILSSLSSSSNLSQTLAQSIFLQLRTLVSHSQSSPTD